MHRLRDQSAFIDGLTDVQSELTWETDAFALADNVDDTGRFGGLVLPTDARPALVTGNSLIVKPELATAQRQAEARPVADKVVTGGGEVVTPVAEMPLPGGGQAPRTLRRFFGAKTLSDSSAALDFATLSREVLSHLVGDTGTQVRIRVEIEAERSDGFSESTVRTVKENAQALKFDDAGFEES